MTKNVKTPRESFNFKKYNNKNNNKKDILKPEAIESNEPSSEMNTEADSY